jgi:hypothetical protein
MPAIRFQTSSVETEHAVSETMKRVNAKALALLSRRTEINRRIRYLHKVMKALHDLSTNPSFNGSDGGPPKSAIERTRPVDNSASREPTTDQLRSSHPRQLQPPPTGLTRACRIAFMEAAGTASADEIRTRIVRRGSFSFSDSGSADAETIRTLTAMTDGGEVRRLAGSPQSLWQLTAPVSEGDTSP